MATIFEPLLVAAIFFSAGMAVTSLLPNGGREANEIGAKMTFYFALGPACLAIVILVLSGVADHFYLIR